MNNTNNENEFLDTLLASVPLSALLANPVQPFGRTEGKKVRDLKKAITASKVIVPIVVIPYGRDFIVGDGHRRSHVAGLLGHRNIMANILPEGTDPVGIFEELNKGMMSFSGNQWFQVWSVDSKSLRLPAVQRRNIEKIVAWVGKDHAHALAAQGVAPSIANMVDSILSVQIAHPRRDRAPLTGGEVLAWVMQDNWRDVRHFISKRYSGSPKASELANQLFKTIRTGAKLP